MINTACSRRKALTILKNFFTFGAVFSLVPTFLSSCKKTSVLETEEAPESKGPIIPCPLDQLSSKEIAIRERLKYTDESPISTRNCKNCKLYSAPKDNSHCGGCSALPGPVHPQGYCISWYHRMF